MSDVVERFHRTLVEEIRAQRPSYLTGPFTVAEIYQNLVPYGTHRDRIGVEMNGDYEDALLRLLAGEGGYLHLDSEHALKELREELEASNPNTGLYREFAAVDVRLNPSRLDATGAGGGANGDEPSPEAATPVTDLAPDAAPSEAGGAAERAREAAAAAGSDDGPPSFWSSPVPPDGPPAERRTEPLAAPEPELGTAEPGEATAGTCRWCRAELPEHEKLNFCPFCGTDVALLPCSACGEELQPEWRFCPACGTGVEG